MCKLLYDLSVEIRHKNIIALIQGPDIFISVFFPVRNRRTSICTKMSGCINNMLAIFCKGTAGGPSFTTAYSFIVEWLTVFGYSTNEHLVAGYPILRAGSLEDDPFTIETEISFCIISAKCELLNIL